MKKMSKILALIAAGAFIFGGMLTSCKSSDDDDDDPSVSISADKTSATVGETVTLTAKASNFTPTSYTWTGATEDTTDSSKATLTASSAGEVTVTVSATKGSTTKTASMTITFTAASSGGDDSGSGSGSSLAAGTYAWDFTTGYTETTAVTAGETFKSSPEGLVMTIFAGAKNIKTKNNIYGLRMKVADDGTPTGVQISGLPVNTAFDIAYTYTPGSADGRTFTIADTDTSKTVIDSQTGTSKADYTKTDAKTSTGTISISATGDCFLHTLSITIK